MAHEHWSSTNTGPHGGAAGSAESAAERARTAVKEAAEQTRTNLLHAAEQQKDTGARQIHDIAAAVHRAAKELEPEIPQAAQYVHQAAGWLDSASSSLRQRNVEDMLATLVRFARKQPAAVFGIAALAGLAVSQLFSSPKDSSGPRPASDGLLRYQPLFLIGLGVTLGAAASTLLFPEHEERRGRR